MKELKDGRARLQSAAGVGVAAPPTWKLDFVFVTICSVGEENSVDVFNLTV